jgi:hypothetical protein
MLCFKIYSINVLRLGVCDKSNGVYKTLLQKLLFLSGFLKTVIKDKILKIQVLQIQSFPPYYSRRIITFTVGNKSFELNNHPENLLA